ncbi:hypothetical protein GCM10028820_20650 [Tessaracoccus terricola]
MPPTVLTSALREIPAWAVLQRRLIDEINRAQRLFSERYTQPDGRLRFSGSLDDRDGVDDFYEPFFNWPTFYALGGSADVLDAAKLHWEGVTAQLTEAGMLTGEYENGYDWFHQGESLLFFYALCAADPDDEAFAERAHRFAQLYTDPAAGNYDGELNIIRAPHNGAQGPLVGLSPQWQAYLPTQTEMRPYGLPLEYLPGIESWDDLADPANADLMGQQMQARAVGDVPVNLAATSLAVNRWLYDGDEDSAAWVLRYAEGWWQRARDNGGLLPDNVGPDGKVGSLHDGRWFGGHYGWSWPHGLPSVGMGALVAGINAAFLSGDHSHLDATRTMLDKVLDEAITATVTETPFSLRAGALGRLGEAAATPMTLVPHRFGKHGWFDHGPVPVELAVWLWWWTRSDADWQRVQRVLDGLPQLPHEVMPFRDKAEAGHEAPWLAFLHGDLPDYPTQALSMALGQVARRVALMAADAQDPDNVHLHFWQRVNPVVTEVLGQLISGTPQILYNGGLPFAAVSYEDPDAHRPGLPPDVAALVTGLEPNAVALELVNTSITETRRVRLRAGRFGEWEISEVTSRGRTGEQYPGASTAYASGPGAEASRTSPLHAGELEVELAPAHSTQLVLHLVPATQRPRHHTRNTEGQPASKGNRP